MKTFTFLLIGAGLLALSEQACAQDSQKKPLNNPMYSTQNYKHPNMASAARRWESKEGIAVKAPTPGDARLANYKSQTPLNQPVGGITVDHTPTMGLVDRNYKIQRVSESQSTGSNEYFVKKGNKKKSDSTSVGD